MLATRRLLLLLFAFMTFARDAKASPGDLYGILPLAMGSAGARVTASTDTGASYYNPANLAFAGLAGDSSLELGYGIGIPILSVEHSKGQPRYPDLDSERHGWVMLGGLFSLGGKIKNRATLSFSILHPDNQLIRVESLEMRSPQWYRYQTNPKRPMITAGLGVVLWERWAIGASANVLADIDGDVEFGLDLFNRRVKKRDLGFSLFTKASPIVGTTVKIIEGLKVGFVWRGDQDVRLTMPTSFDVGDIGVLSMSVAGSLHYSPHQFAVGASYDINRSFSVSADLLISLWSQAPFPGLVTQVNYKGELAEAFGLDEVFTFDTGDEVAGFENTVEPSIAGEYRLNDSGAALRAGYSYRPTMVPDQVHTSNLLDSNTHVLAIGATIPFSDPIEVFKRPLKLDLGGQIHFVSSRHTPKKAGASDPVGEHSAGGTVLAFGASLRYDY